QDYVDMEIMDWLGTQEFSNLEAIVDPYSYRNRLVMPKYIMNSTGDEFFLPDSSQFYFDGLQGEKYLRYVPNTDHGLNDAAWNDALAFYWAVLNEVARPEFTWTKGADGSLRVETADTPSEVLLWQATNPDARDFRLEDDEGNPGPSWTSSVMTDQDSGVYLAQVPEPAQGWTGFMVELTFPSGGPEPFKFTTEVSVVPDTLPFASNP
ncbi:MAG: PhoPQ-activated pathogenicity, partial [bacterium]|nr:PhoPQ-activated pathogenicity [bacterium]